MAYRASTQALVSFESPLCKSFAAILSQPRAQPNQFFDSRKEDFLHLRTISLNPILHVVLTLTNQTRA